MSKRKKRSDDENAIVDLEQQNALLRSQLKTQSREEKIEKGKSREKKEPDCCPKCQNKLSAIKLFKVNIPTTIFFCENCNYRKCIDQGVPKPQVSELDDDNYQYTKAGSIWEN